MKTILLLRPSDQSWIGLEEQQGCTKVLLQPSTTFMTHIGDTHGHDPWQCHPLSFLSLFFWKRPRKVPRSLTKQSKWPNSDSKVTFGSTLTSDSKKGQNWLKSEQFFKKLENTWFSHLCPHLESLKSQPPDNVKRNLSQTPPQFRVVETVVLENGVFVPCRKQVVVTKIGEHSDIAFYPLKQGILFLRPGHRRKWRKRGRASPKQNDWGAANGGLRDGGLRKSEDIWGKRPFSSVFWIFQVLFGPSGKGRKRQKKGEKGRFWPISRTGGQTPLIPPFVTPPFAALQEWPFAKSTALTTPIFISSEPLKFRGKEKHKKEHARIRMPQRGGVV